MIFFLIAAQVLVALAAISWFCHTYGISQLLVLVHLPLVATAVAVAYGPSRVALVLRWPRTARVLATVVPWLVTSALAALYIADFRSQRALDSNLTYVAIRTVFVDWRRGGDMLELSGGVYAGLGGAVVALLFLHAALSGRVVRAFEAMRASPGFLARHRRVWVPALAVVMALGARQFAQRTPASELLTNDPLLALMRRSTYVYDERHLALMARLRVSEPAARAAYPRGLAFDRKNVIVIIVDSLRADHMSLYGYSRPTTPFLQSLEAGGHLRKVDLATSTCSETGCGVLSTLDSKSLRAQIPEDFKLHDLLKDQGYKTYFLLSGNHRYNGLSENYGHEQTLYLDGESPNRYSVFDDRLVFDGLDRVPDHDGPAFFYVHLMSPHLYGLKQDQYRTYQPSKVSQDWATLLDGTPDRERIVNNYDNGVTQADAMIRDLFAALARKGYLKNAVVAILGDHGEGLGERGREFYSHLLWLYQEFIHIPMLFWDSSPVTYANLEFATQVDVAPTIVQRLGLPIPSSWEGRSLFDSRIRDWSVHQTTIQIPCYAFIYRKDSKIYKYVYYSVGKIEELYELTTDPGERVSLMDAAEPALVARFRGERDRVMAQ